MISRKHCFRHSICIDFITDEAGTLCLILCFVYFLCTVLGNLKSNYEEALSRNDVKAIVITGMSGDHSFLLLKNRTSFMQTLEMVTGFCVFSTTGEKGKFSGGFDISGFGEMQKGTSMFQCICIFGDCIGVMY